MFQTGTCTKSQKNDHIAPLIIARNQVNNIFYVHKTESRSKLIDHVPNCNGIQLNVPQKRNKRE